MKGVSSRRRNRRAAADVVNLRQTRVGQTAHVDAATVGFKTTQEIDEAIENMNLALS